MNVPEMREFIGAKYPSQHWKTKVAKMAPNQVIAIYHSIKNREEKLSRTSTDENKPVQLDIFDVFGYNIIRRAHS